MKKVLFIESVHDVLQKKLEVAGYICENLHDSSREQILRLLPEYFGVVIRSRISADQEFFDAAIKLKFIARSGSGLENIDVKYAESKGISVFNSPEGNRDAVGEHATAMLLMLLNKLKFADQDVRKGLWPREKNRGIEISGKTIAIIGYGMMGSSFAEKLSGFGANVIAYDKYKTGYSNRFVKESNLEEIYRSADIVSLHLPLTSETVYYANHDFFSRFSNPIIFINTARGKNTDTTSLVEAMKNGAVAGACLDVIEYEKISLEGLESGKQADALTYLIESNNTILTPHIAGWTYESYYKLSDVLAEKILEKFGSPNPAS